MNRHLFQSYCSALVFAPEKSIIRASFEEYIPAWIQIKPKVQAYWSAALQTLEGHSGSVRSVAFSPDGKQVNTPLLVSNDWIVEEDMKILWLPPDYRSPSCIAVWNRNLVLGYQSGRLSLLGFQDEYKFYNIDQSTKLIIIYILGALNIIIFLLFPLYFIEGPRGVYFLIVYRYYSVTRIF